MLLPIDSLLYFVAPEAQIPHLYSLIKKSTTNSIKVALFVILSYTERCAAIKSPGYAGGVLTAVPTGMKVWPELLMWVGKDSQRKTRVFEDELQITRQYNMGVRLS